MPRGRLGILRCDRTAWHLGVRMWPGVMLGDLRERCDYCSHLQPQPATCADLQVSQRLSKVLFPQTSVHGRFVPMTRHFEAFPSFFASSSSKRPTKSRSSKLQSRGAPRSSTKSLESSCNLSVERRGRESRRFPLPEMSISSSGPGDPVYLRCPFLFIGTADASTRCLHAQIYSTGSRDWVMVPPTWFTAGKVAEEEPPKRLPSCIVSTPQWGPFD